MFTFEDLTSELHPKLYNVVTLRQVVEVIDQVNHTLEVLEEEGHEFEYWDVVRDTMNDYFGVESCVESC